MPAAVDTFSESTPGAMLILIRRSAAALLSRRGPVPRRRAGARRGPARAETRRHPLDVDGGGAGREGEEAVAGLAEEGERARPVGGMGEGRDERRAHRDADRLSVQRVGGALREDGRVGAGGPAFRNSPPTLSGFEISSRRTTRRRPGGRSSGSSGSGAPRSPSAAQPRWKSKPTSARAAGCSRHTRGRPRPRPRALAEALERRRREQERSRAEARGGEQLADDRAALGHEQPAGEPQRRTLGCRGSRRRGGPRGRRSSRFDRESRVYRPPALQ